MKAPIIVTITTDAVLSYIGEQLERCAMTAALLGYPVKSLGNHYISFQASPSQDNGILMSVGVDYEYQGVKQSHYRAEVAPACENCGDVHLMSYAFRLATELLRAYAEETFPLLSTAVTHEDRLAEFGQHIVKAHRHHDTSLN